MNHNDDDEWDEEDDEFMNQHSKGLEIQKLFAEMADKAKKVMHYMVLEGFVEPTENPQVYKYTTEGFVLAQKEYKRLKDQGLL